MPPTLPSQYHIRPASSALHDGARILAFTDSQLPYLASIGSGAQWGPGPASEAHQTRYRNLISRSEQTQIWGKDWLQVCILEVHVDDIHTLPEEVRDLVITTTSHDGKSGRLPVAAMVLEGHSSAYTRPVIAEQASADPFVYVRYLVTDRRVGDSSRGAGRVLLEHADGVARALGLGRLVLDGWNGNGGLLVRYYEKQGFVRLGDVDDDGWPATVLERRVK